MPMEGTRRRRTRKAIWDPTEDTRPQWREALTTRVLYREVCGLAARENGLAHLSLEDVVGKIALHMRRDVSELEARDEAIAALVERYVQPSDSDSASDDEVCLGFLSDCMRGRSTTRASTSSGHIRWLSLSQ